MRIFLLTYLGLILACVGPTHAPLNSQDTGNPPVVPVLQSLQASQTSITAQQVVSLTVTLSAPVAADTAVSITVIPSGAGTCPSNVTILNGNSQATFDFTAAFPAISAQIRADLATDSKTVDLTGPKINRLIINEVDYDNVGSDTAEFVEIYNPTGAAVDLTNVSLYLVNGTVTAPATPDTYRSISLASGGSLAAGGYLVVWPVGLSSSFGPGVIKVEFNVASAIIQNGSPDGLALVDSGHNLLLDSLCYGGSMTNVSLAGLTATYNLVSVTDLDSNVSNGALARAPDTGATGDLMSFAFSSNVTPGAANN